MNSWCMCESIIAIAIPMQLLIKNQLFAWSDELVTCMHEVAIAN